jgi:hypothetical protein
MTDEVSVPDEISSGSSEQSSHEPTQVSESNESMVPQSKVNEIVGAIKRSAYDKAYQDALSKVEADRPPPPAKTDDIDDRVSRLVDEKLKQANAESQKATAASVRAANWKNIVTSLQPKVDEAAKKYEDFHEVTNIDFRKLDYLLEAADKVENSGDVLYHLCKKPSQFREMAMDLKLEDGDPYRDMAMRKLNALSSSLKDNDVAMQKDLPRSPLSQIKPSNVGSDNGNPTRAELRRKFRV